jgi:Flp pilus assembly protein TadD
VQAFEHCLSAARTLHGLYQRSGIERDDALRELETAMREGDVRHDRLPLLAAATRSHGQTSVASVFEAPAPLLLSLGSAHFRKGDPVAAEQYWTRAVKVDDRLGEAWNNLAVVYKNADRTADAEAALRRAERVGFRVHPRLRQEILSMR